MITVFGSNTTVADLAGIPVERPKRALSHWKGVPHEDLVGSILDEAKVRGWKVTDTRLALSPDKADLAGAFSLSVPGIDPPEGQSFSLGFLHSNAMRRPMKLAVGSNILVCSNGMVTGEIVLIKKHTKRFNLFERVEEAFDDYAEKIRRIPILVASLRERQLEDGEVDRVLMQAGRDGLMPWSRVGRVDQEYREPTYSEHGTGTSWTLLNAFTEVVKMNPPLRQMDQINRFRAMLPTTAL